MPPQPVGHAYAAAGHGYAARVPGATMRRVITPSARFALSCTAIAVLGGCDGPSVSEPPLSQVSLSAAAGPEILEADDRSVSIGLSFSPAPPVGVLVPLAISGTATRDRDYAVSTDLIALGPDQYWVPAHTSSGSVQVEVFRDFDAEDDETISVALGDIRGHARAGAASRVEFTVVDGGGGSLEVPDFPEPGPTVLPTHYVILPESVDFGAIVVNFSLHGAPADELIVEWSSEPDFSADVNRLATVHIPPFVAGFQGFPEPHEFSLPLNRLAPGGSYFIRMYLLNAPASDFGQFFGGEFAFAFATNERGEVITRCEAPVRGPGVGVSDPLLLHQWNLDNAGQAALAARPGVAGADLRMSAAIAAGHDGDGVTLAVVDTGLEICHPDLAASVKPGKSYNFGFAQAAGASLTDPFNHDIRGDHGTAVAGVAAAAAGNGLGGRGVAPGVELVGFNLGAVAVLASGEFDGEEAMFRSLGASSSEPDSASVDIFNMSFGFEIQDNSTPDFVRLVKMGTSELRGGRGALYVKAAGNEFTACSPIHVLNRELGCVGSNSDPDQNLPYLVNVGAFNAEDVKSSYSSAGANLWVVAPGGEDSVESPGIITADQAGTHAGLGLLFGEDVLSRDLSLDPHGDYTAGFGGTSAAAPGAAGAIAILLGVNPDLTWRDVKHILAASARRIDPDIAPVRAAFNGKPYVLRHPWQTNAAGYAYHNWYGFGAIAVDDAVALARTHAPGSLGEFVESAWFEAGDGLDLVIPDNDGAGAAHSLDVAGLPDAADIEAVVLEIRARHADTSDLAVELTSPAGTLSILNTPFNQLLSGDPRLQDWHLMSNAFYGEPANGTWTLRVLDLAPGDTGHLVSWRLRFYYGDHP